MRRSVTIAVLVLLALALLPATVAQAAWRAAVTVPGPTIVLDHVPPPVPQTGGNSQAVCQVTNAVGGLLFSKVTLNWAWPDGAGWGSGQASNPDKFYLRISVPSQTTVSTVEAVDATLRSKDLDKNTLSTLLTSVLGLDLGAIVNGTAIKYELSAGIRNARSTVLTTYLKIDTLLLHASCASSP